MTVADLTARAAQRATAEAIARAKHPSSIRFSAPRKALYLAATMIGTCDLPDPASISVFSEGTGIVFDYTGRPHAAGDVRQACQALGMTVEELAADTPDGCAAVELRGHDSLDGIYRCVRAVIPIPATFTDVR